MGAARCFHQKQLTPSLLTQQLKELFGRPVKLKKMRESMKQWKRDCATEEVVKRIYEVCGWEYSKEDDLIVSEPGLTEVAA
jgi:UDP-N-acetylglucosamine:LPS N-acetylglucosamine transferase